MMMIAGTIRENVKMAQMTHKVEEKKAKGFRVEKNLTEEERMLNMFQEQIEQNREADNYTKISTKIQSGETLTAEEIRYLEQNNPQLLKTYREIQQEKKSYERQLRNCKTKEEVERLKVNKLNGYMAQAKDISTNPYIPKAKKKALLEAIMAKITNMQKVHYKFVKSTEYENLAEEDEMAKERAKLASERQDAEAELIEDTSEEETQENDGKIEGVTLPLEEETKETGRQVALNIAEAKDVLAFVQTALTNLNENVYNSEGDAVPLDKEYKMGKRIDIKG